MEVMDIQQVFPLPAEPLLFGEGLALGTVAVAAGILRNSLVAAVVAEIHMRAQSRCAAQEDTPGSFPLLGRKLAPRRIILKIGGEDVLDLSHLSPLLCQQGSQYLFWCWKDADKSW